MTRGERSLVFRFADSMLEQLALAADILRHE